jgi:adenylate cyclase
MAEASPRPANPRVRFPLSLKFGAASAGVLGVTLLAVLGVSYRFLSRSVEISTGEELFHVAATAAPFVSGDDHAALNTVEDADSPAYLRVQQTLAKVQHENRLEEYDIFTVRRSAGGFELGVGLRERPMLGFGFTPAPELAPALHAALEEGIAGSTPVYHDQFGQFVSAVAPIRDSKGNVVAALEVDRDLELVNRARRVWLVRVASLGGLGLVMGMLLAWAVSRSVTGPVRELTLATAAVGEGRYDARVQATSSDEVGVLARAFNLMLTGLRERLEMLRFVPRHTREMISLAAQGDAARGEAFRTQRQERVVMFSDIRGFTTLSNSLAPETILQMLNIYLKAEAEIVERHGGIIDKFIGDAVMALFDRADAHDAAARAALEIQATLSRLNAQGAFDRPIQVGIGIAGGEIAFGAVGYEQRQELASIGPVVNLASRLTSLAGPGEIVVSETFSQRAGPGFTFEPRPPAKLKGFSEPQQHCFLRG